ncbi:hypothetical protein P43SY_003087 [Pythium insidiosum]|uniref:Fungal lipase-type domain-containing protein n=1 Tax=Pythium insidiosum TaxID=114742 RepID=A0AAD5LP85_PYTIN|nr:hypothetical protein P43SY_003087 [Pythium insidiosum]
MATRPLAHSLPATPDAAMPVDLPGAGRSTTPYLHAETMEDADHPRQGWTVPVAELDDDRATALRQRRSVFHAVHAKDAAMTTTEGRGEELFAYHDNRTLWRFYRTFCQLRFGYLAFLVLMVILMFSFTLLMEIFFAIFLPSARTYSTEYLVRSVVLLALLPILLILLSYAFEEASRLFFDAINKMDGGLPNFRLALAIVIHYVRHRRAICAADAPDASAVASDSMPRASRQLLRRATSSIFLDAREDPYVDEDPFVDDDRDDVHALAAIDAMLDDRRAPPDGPPAGEISLARRRWQRVTTFVRAAVLLRQHHAASGPPIDFSTFILVDIVCPVGFELLTLVSFFAELFDSWSVFDGFLACVRAGFWLMLAYLLTWMATHFWSSRNRHMRVLVSDYRRRRRLLRREVYDVLHEKKSRRLWLMDVGFRFYHHVGVYANPLGWFRRSPARSDVAELRASMMLSDTELSRTDDTRIDVAVAADERSVARRLARIREARAKLHAKNPWHSVSDGYQMLVLLAVCIASALVSMWSFLTGWILMGVAIVLLGNVAQRRFPQIFGNTFRYFMAAFVLLSLVFFSSTWIIGTFVGGGSFRLGPYVPSNSSSTDGATGTSVRHAALVALQAPGVAEYPVCTIDYDGLSVLDLALIADAAYGSTAETQNRSLLNRFDGTELDDWRVVNRSNSSEHQVWMEIFFARINMTVVAVRGTASATDALEDLHYWFGISIMQAVNVFVPFLRQLPRDFVVSLLSMKLIAKFMPAPVFMPLMDHVDRVKQRVGSDRMVVTGHSLGGALAAVAGARTQTRAVSFSGPGLLFSRGRFGVEESDVRDFVLTLKPQKDIVPQVDELGGMVQELRCWEKSPMACHSTETHMCELQAACGDPRGRNWATNEKCTRYRALMKP